MVLVVVFALMLQVRDFTHTHSTAAQRGAEKSTAEQSSGCVVAPQLHLFPRLQVHNKPFSNGKMNNMELFSISVSFVVFFVAANLGPLGYALPNLLLWVFAGIAQPEVLARRPVGTG